MKFLLYIPVAFIILLLSVVIINALYIKTNYYENSVKQIKKFTGGVPSDLDIINTGSSYALYGLSYEGTGLKGFNFGLQPQTLSYDFKILQQFQKHLNENCIVLIVLPDLVFGFTDPENDHSNTKYYYFLDKERINNYSTMKYITKVKIPVLSASKKILHIIKDTKADNSYTLATNPYTPEQTEKQAEIRINGWKKQFGLNNMITGDFSDSLQKAFDNNIKTVNEMIAFCLENNFRPVLLVPPVSSILNSKYSKSFMDDVLYKNIKKANTQSVPLLDYLYDERFQDYNLYINADLLNTTGRKKLTQAVIEDLRKISYV